MAPHLSQEEFLSSLSTLLTKTSEKARGSVFLTQKPLLQTPSSDESASPSTLPPILIRATDGNTSAPNPKSSKDQNKKAAKTSKVKLSTVVAQEELEAFFARYAEVCKAGMTGLKKRDRKKGKAKAKGAASKVTKA
ncbi:signal recognition particle 14 kDa protein [Aspergillus clavatus NRRL 1]|uniref:Signal recognition particle subunit SRP14 n=1 Tax=Aspergillus clavatus (strain ATCC 1007 / CBS 513.65 / DSM 816 / NCTC 3887 / NRRL 1 / QM 1276 / 107) TaxID=344612 RepID=A1CFD6_ASPCL|nr:signal recognition particle 14kD protein, putative [Aspergillus clavatus NRRL 1]EAW11585.1 signal recognition particle 14kD protein, putative [Aspergillus clavatus NRRL 1]